MEQFPAHIRIAGTGGDQVQSVTEHCRAVSAYACTALQPAGLSGMGRLTGLIHDAGKFTAAFRDYITRAGHGEQVHKGSVNHTFAGVRLLFERCFDPDGSPFRNMACEILAFVAGSHHGMFDCIDPTGQDGFSHRLDAQGIFYEEAKANFLSHCTDAASLDALFDEAVRELENLVARCKKFVKTQDELLVCMSMACRLVLSAVIEGDRRDTAEFTHNMTFPPDPADPGAVWKVQLEAVEEKLRGLPEREPVDRVRRLISDRCRTFPVEASGIYRLSVPTGGGKTLTALRFALSAAQRHHKSRIFFVIPLLSVLEQNAKVIREYLTDDSLILEHHSNVLRVKHVDEKLDDNELLMETWRAPVVITTLVQLLNTLFDGNPTCIRRMNALADSIIVLDEVQSVPRHMISQFNLALSFLTGVCKSTVVLCSATQPCYEATDHPLSPKPLDLVPHDEALWQPFRRTVIHNQCRSGGYTPEELAAFALERLPEVQSLLLICNKKAQAETLYRLLCHADAHVFHLSTAMCMAHRMDTLEQINALLGNAPVICVATQMVECGVDFSFGCVIRIFAGLDNLLQSAGRCNRSGEFHRLCPVYLVNLHEENLSRLREIQDAQIAMKELLSSFERDSGAFDGDLQSDRAVQYYYRRFFGNMPRFAQDYPIPQYGTTMLKLLGFNEPFRQKNAQGGRHTICQAFRTAGDQFQVFDDNTVDVLVPYRDGAEIIAALCSDRAKADFLYRKQLLDRAKKYTVSLFQYQYKLLLERHGLHSLCGDAAYAVQPAFYREDTGMDLSGGNQVFLEG